MVEHQESKVLYRGCFAFSRPLRSHHSRAATPGSFLGSKMVQEAYGRAGKDLAIGANILTRGVLDDEFTEASGQYFDNDSGRFSMPHADALDSKKRVQVVEAIESIMPQRLES